MFDRFSRWWHAAEQDVVEIFASRILPLVLIETALLVAFWALFPQPKYLIGIGLIAVVVGIRKVAEGRRAIIFSSNEIINRPVFGPPKRIALGEVIQVKNSMVARSFGLRATFVRGVELTLERGEKVQWPLDLPGANKIIERLEFHAKSNGGKGSPALEICFQNEPNLP